MHVCQRDYTVKNPRGIHATPAGALVQLASSYSCEVLLIKENQTINAKSIIGLLSLEAKCGETLTVMTVGEQAEKALTDVGKKIESVLE
ncbi:HPr family phosphocarrier protein [Paenibacillus marinisediminis]